MENSNWISVKYTEPEEEGTYLTYNGNCIGMAVYDPSNGKWRQLVTPTDWVTTHWQPLPQPPHQ